MSKLGALGTILIAIVGLFSLDELQIIEGMTSTHYRTLFGLVGDQVIYFFDILILLGLLLNFPRLLRWISTKRIVIKLYDARDKSEGKNP